MATQIHEHTVGSFHHHFGWDNRLKPVATVPPGATVSFQLLESSAGQLTRSSVAADVNHLDFNRVNPTTGPIGIDGAEPGDALKITLLEFEPSGWGWTAIIPGFGLLADQFPEASLHHWSYDPTGSRPALLGRNARVPLKPMAGSMGVAPAEAGHHSTLSPRRGGGTLDIRDLATGSTLYLPVEVPGALFSIGDPHAAQGDGEVCGSGIESPMNVILRLELVKHLELSMPRFTTPGPVTNHLSAKGYEVTTGVGPDLMTCARVAVANMIEFLGKAHGISASDAYMLCSVCGDLRVSEIVDVPNWVMSFYFPRVVLE